MLYRDVPPGQRLAWPTAPIWARPVGRLERAVKWCRRRPVTAGLIAALALVTALGLGAFLWQSDEARRAAEGKLKAVEGEQAAQAERLKEATARLKAEEARGRAFAARDASDHWVHVNLGDSLLRASKVAPALDREAFIYDLETDTELFRIPLKVAASAVSAAFSPSGDEVAYVLGRNAVTSQQVQVLFSADGRWLLVSHRNEGSGEIHVRELPGGAVVRTLTALDVVPTGMVLSADRKRLFLAGDTTDMKVWDLENGRELLTLPGRLPNRGLMSLGLLRDETLLYLVAPGEVLLWDGTPAQPKR